MQGLEALYKSNQTLLGGRAELMQQNAKLREMIADLGGDASLVPPSASPANEGATSSTQTPSRAKRQRVESRIEDRVTHTSSRCIYQSERIYGAVWKFHPSVRSTIFTNDSKSEAESKAARN